MDRAEESLLFPSRRRRRSWPVRALAGTVVALAATGCYLAPWRRAPATLAAADGAAPAAAAAPALLLLDTPVERADNAAALRAA